MTSFFRSGNLIQIALSSQISVAERKGRANEEMFNSVLLIVVGAGHLRFPETACCQ